MKGQALVVAGLAWCQISSAAGNDPTYMQREFAKNPSGKCAKHGRAVYDEKAKTDEGIKELIVNGCQNEVRANYHTRLSQKVKPTFTPDNEIQLAIDCVQEQIAILESLQQVGVTRWTCPTK